MYNAHYALNVQGEVFVFSPNYHFNLTTDPHYSEHNK